MFILEAAQAAPSSADWVTGGSALALVVSILVGLKLAAEKLAAALEKLPAALEANTEAQRANSKAVESNTGAQRELLDKLKAFAPLLLLPLVLLCGGCVNQQLAGAFESYHQATAPEYRQLVHEAYKKTPEGTFEPWYTPEQRERRDRTLDAAQRVVDELHK
jgi:hypothetical protein